MTSPTDTTTEPITEPSEVDADQSPDTQDAEQPADDSAPAKLRREAAGYRAKLREAEQDRDTARGELDSLAARLDTLTRRAAEDGVRAGIGGVRLHDPADLWRYVQPTDLVDDSGAVVEAKLRAALERIGKEAKHLTYALPDLAGRRAGRPLSTADNGTSIGDVFRPITDPTYEGYIGA
jgi:hypothetical protein